MGKTATIIYTFLFLFLHGCRTPKNVSKSDASASVTEQQASEVKSNELSALIDTTKTTRRERSAIKIEFYPPGGVPAEGGRGDDSATTGRGAEGKQDSRPGRGAVKSIEILSDKDLMQYTGITDTKQTASGEKKSIAKAEESKGKEETGEVAADPYKWRYILFTVITAAAIAAAAYILCRKKGWINTFSGFIKKLFAL